VDILGPHGRKHRCGGACRVRGRNLYPEEAVTSWDVAEAGLVLAFMLVPILVWVVNRPPTNSVYQQRTRESWRAIAPTLSDAELRQVLQSVWSRSDYEREHEIILVVSEELARRQKHARVIREWN
jgi:hypothetical protein